MDTIHERFKIILNLRAAVFCSFHFAFVSLSWLCRCNLNQIDYLHTYSFLLSFIQLCIHFSPCLLFRNICHYRFVYLPDHLFIYLKTNVSIYLLLTVLAFIISAKVDKILR